MLFFDQFSGRYFSMDVIEFNRKISNLFFNKNLTYGEFCEAVGLSSIDDAKDKKLCVLRCKTGAFDWTKNCFITDIIIET